MTTTIITPAPGDSDEQRDWRLDSDVGPSGQITCSPSALASVVRACVDTSQCDPGDTYVFRVSSAGLQHVITVVAS